jgi:hypothetical protein
MAYNNFDASADFCICFAIKQETCGRQLLKSLETPKAIRSIDSSIYLLYQKLKQECVSVLKVAGLGSFKQHFAATYRADLSYYLAKNPNETPFSIFFYHVMACMLHVKLFLKDTLPV